DMEPMIVHVSPQTNADELVTHSGQEFNYVLSGVVKVVIGNREFILSEGDSIYFNPIAPHGQRAVGGDATFLTVINE
ncbi:MAG: cupin domain-containing protein, partial [Eubacteriales bacterium]